MVFSVVLNSDLNERRLRSREGELLLQEKINTILPTAIPSWSWINKAQDVRIEITFVLSVIRHCWKQNLWNNSVRITVFTGKEQAVLGVYRGCLTVSSTDRACYKCCPIPTAQSRDLLRDLAQLQQEGSASTCFTVPLEAYLHLWHLNIINNLALPPSMPHFQVRGIEHPILGLLKEKKCWRTWSAQMLWCQRQHLMLCVLKEVVEEGWVSALFFWETGQTYKVHSDLCPWSGCWGVQDACRTQKSEHKEIVTAPEHLTKPTTNLHAPRIPPISCIQGAKKAWQRVPCWKRILPCSGEYKPHFPPPGWRQRPGCAQNPCRIAQLTLPCLLLYWDHCLA